MQKYIIECMHAVGVGLKVNQSCKTGIEFWELRWNAGGVAMLVVLGLLVVLEVLGLLKVLLDWNC
jgi:hypothetical protein